LITYQKKWWNNELCVGGVTNNKVLPPTNDSQLHEEIRNGFETMIERIHENYMNGVLLVFLHHKPPAELVQP